jgi:hypothetical protein
MLTQRAGAIWPGGTDYVEAPQSRYPDNGVELSRSCWDVTSVTAVSIVVRSHAVENTVPSDAFDERCC